MATLTQILEGVQSNSQLIAAAGSELGAINARIAELVKSIPGPAQLEELQQLVAKQGADLSAIVDTAKQTAPLSPSPVEPTPAPSADVPATPAEEAPVVEVPATPDNVNVEPTPDDIGLEGSVAIDAVPVEPPLY